MQDKGYEVLTPPPIEAPDNLTQTLNDLYQIVGDSERARRFYHANSDEYATELTVPSGATAHAGATVKIPVDPDQEYIALYYEYEMICSAATVEPHIGITDSIHGSWLQTTVFPSYAYIWSTYNVTIWNHFVSTGWPYMALYPHGGFVVYEASQGLHTINAYYWGGAQPGTSYFRNHYLWAVAI